MPRGKEECSQESYDGKGAHRPQYGVASCDRQGKQGIKDGVTRTCSSAIKGCDMETKIKLFFDPVGNTLTVWFGDPDQEHLCEETGNDVILMKDGNGQVIGFEKLNFVPLGTDMPLVSFETMAVPAR